VITRPSSRRAFTLIEIMIVIGIIAMVMTAGVPMMWRALAKDPLAKAVNDVLEGCKLARDMSILQNKPYEFVIRNRTENDAEMLVEAAKIKDPSGLAFPGSDKPAHSAGSLASAFPRKLGEDVAVELLAVNLADMMEASEARARFYPNGTADEFTVVFHRNGVRRTVQVDIITGAAFEVIK
jgi:prepilin-type N-terminal cleavage/methylation domain-containing protein